MTRCALDRADDRAEAPGPAARCRVAYRHQHLRSGTADACRVPAPFGPPVSAPGWTLRLRGRVR